MSGLVQKKPVFIALSWVSLSYELYNGLIQFTKCLVGNGMAFQFMGKPNEIFISYRHLIKAQFTYIHKIK